MQQGDSLALPPGFSSQLSPPQDHHNSLTRHDDGTHIDTSLPAYQNSTSQCPFPDSAWNTTIETHNGMSPVVDKKTYCSWQGCRQSHKEYTPGELKYVLVTHICSQSRR